MGFRSWTAASLTLGILALAGCGGGSSPQTVEGTVTLDGAPLAGAYVSITPKEGADKLPFVATTDEQGHYSLGSIKDPGGGAPPGAYTLIITTGRDTSGDENAPRPVERVRPPHSSPGVDFEVPADGKTDADFALTSKK